MGERKCPLTTPAFPIILPARTRAALHFKQPPGEPSLPQIHPDGGCQLLSPLQFSGSLQPAYDEITDRAYPFQPQITAKRETVISNDSPQVQGQHRGLWCRKENLKPHQLAPLLASLSLINLQPLLIPVQLPCHWASPFFLSMPPKLQLHLRPHLQSQNKVGGTDAFWSSSLSPGQRSPLPPGK